MTSETSSENDHLPIWPIFIRLGIPVLRYLSWVAALMVIASPGITFAAPIQKLVVVPLAHLIWAILALTPFILLRRKVIYQAYVYSFLAVLTILTYDYWVPFRYVSPGYWQEISDGGGGFSRSGNDDNVAYWISYPTVPQWGDIMPVLFTISPLLLAFVYRRFYPMWANLSKES